MASTAMRAARPTSAICRRGLNQSSSLCPSKPGCSPTIRSWGHNGVAGLAARRAFASSSGSNGLPALNDWLRVSDEVADAVAKNKPLVALESTIYTHGALSKDLPLEHEDLVRSLGGIPAIIAIVDGVPTVGVSGSEMIRMVERGDAAKVSRRDISYLVGMVSERYNLKLAGIPLSNLLYRALLAAGCMAALQSRAPCCLQNWLASESLAPVVSVVFTEGVKTPWISPPISLSLGAHVLLSSAVVVRDS